MIWMYLAFGVALIIAGTTLGFLMANAIGIHREEKDRSLTIGSPGRIASSARAANGVYARKPGVAQQVSHPRADSLALAGPGPRI
jgi:hypothetical protein